MAGRSARSRKQKKLLQTSQAKDDAPKPIQLFVETVVEESAGVTADSQFSFADPAAAGLAALGEFKETDNRKTNQPQTSGSSNDSSHVCTSPLLLSPETVSYG